ncbi:MAG: prolipoprotein diacylglyceryl transferase [Anaerolineae bacterium]|nr:prolipoprotein diacylglyceryl transferase [Anaerolineae bacterium]
MRKIYTVLRAEPYWAVIILFWLMMGGLYLNHLFTGATPNRVAVNLTFLGDFPVYWYGIIIMAGVTLGAYTATQLARERALRIWQETVPASVRQRPLTTLALPPEIQTVLSKNRITTLGELLLLWGFNPELLGLKRIQLKTVREKLNAAANVDPLWVGEDAPWRIWNPDYVWGGIGVCLVLGVIGARLYHVLTPSPSMAALGINSPLDYFRNPWQLINLRNGGLGIYGGIIGGAVGLIWYTWRHRLPLLGWADLAAVGLVLGQMMGRWGNFFNQELYGRPTTLPWAVTIDPANRLPGYSEVAQFHPAFLYESIWSLLTFIGVYTLIRRYGERLLPGEITALYLIAYAVGRTLLELIRLDSRTGVGGLPIATLVSLLIAVGMAAWLFLRRQQIGRDE